MPQQKNSELKILNEQQFGQYCSFISDEKDLVDTSHDGYDEKKEALYFMHVKGFLRNCLDKTSCYEDPFFNKRMEGLFYHTLSEWNRHAGHVSDKKKGDLAKMLDETMTAASGIDRKDKLKEAFYAYHKLIDILPGNSEGLKKEREFFKEMIAGSRHFEFMKEQPSPNDALKARKTTDGRG